MAPGINNMKGTRRVLGPVQRQTAQCFHSLLLWDRLPGLLESPEPSLSLLGPKVKCKVNESLHKTCPVNANSKESRPQTAAHICSRLPS